MDRQPTSRFLFLRGLTCVGKWVSGQHRDRGVSFILEKVVGESGRQEHSTIVVCCVGLRDEASRPSILAGRVVLGPRTTGLSAVTVVIGEWSQIRLMHKIYTF